MSGSGTLTLRGVTKEYEVDGRPLRVLDDINLEVTPGELVSIVGSSGCGKSTLLRLIVGLDPQYEGQILQDGQPILGPELSRGIVFQDHRLLPWLTLEKNVSLALENTPLSAEARRETVASHIELVGLSGFEKVYPHQLSGGMAQRAAIARGLVNRPDILLLDEPFGALDAVTRVHLQDELLRIVAAHKTTVILVTHDVEEAIYIGDTVVVMLPNPGRIARRFKVELPGQRDRTSHAFVAQRHLILEQMTAASVAKKPARVRLVR